MPAKWRDVPFFSRGNMEGWYAVDGWMSGENWGIAAAHSGEMNDANGAGAMPAAVRGHGTRQEWLGSINRQSV